MYKNELLLENLNKFFDDEKNKQILIDVLNNKYNIYFYEMCFLGKFFKKHPLLIHRL